jgi:hypothetical protein
MMKRRRFWTSFCVYGLLFSLGQLQAQAIPSGLFLSSAQGNGMVQAEAAELRIDLEAMPASVRSLWLMVDNNPWALIPLGSLVEPRNMTFRLDLTGLLSRSGTPSLALVAETGSSGLPGARIRSAAVPIQPLRSGWNQKRGSNGRNPQFDGGNIRTGDVRLERLIELDGLIEQAPVADSQRLYLTMLHTSKDGFETRLHGISLADGSTVFSQPLLSVQAMAAGNWIEHLLVDPDKGVIFAVENTGRSVHVRIHSTRTGQRLYLTDAIPVIGATDALLAGGLAGRPLVLAGLERGSAGASILGIYTVDATGLVQQPASRMLPPGASTGSRSDARPSLTVVPGSLAAAGTTLALAWAGSIHFLADLLAEAGKPELRPAVQVRTALSGLVNASLSNIGDGASQPPGQLLWADSNGYTLVKPGKGTWTLEQIPGFGSMVPDAYAWSQGRIYHYRNVSGEYWLESLDPSRPDGLRSVRLSTDRDYSREYFLVGFDVPPVPGRSFIATVDRNYTLYLVDRSGLEQNNQSALRTLPAPGKVTAAKTLAELLPFGRSHRPFNRGYYRQPELVVAGDRLIVTTAEASPNFIMIYRMK